MKFEKGNIVEHKAGGPKMVICSVESDDRYFCSWWSEANNRFDGTTLQAEELELLEKGKS